MPFALLHQRFSANVRHVFLGFGQGRFGIPRQAFDHEVAVLHHAAGIMLLKRQVTGRVLVSLQSTTI